MNRASLFLARLALLWERAAPVLWPIALAIGLFSVLALFGLWEHVGDPWRAIAGVLILGSGGWLAWRASRAFVSPTAEDAARRVEEDSNIPARPHEALSDTPSGGDAASNALWDAHQARMAERLKGARARQPKAAWATLDVWGARIALVVLVGLGWGVAGDFASGRLLDAFSPQPLLRGESDVNVDAWLDPPAYTGRAPILLRDGDMRASAPEGSVFTVRVAGARRTPALRLDGVNGENRSIGDGVWESRLPVSTDGTVTLRAGRTRLSWAIDAIADTPPDVRLTGVPEARASGELSVTFTVDDDYGAVSYRLQFRAIDDRGGDWDEIEITSASMAETTEGLRALVDTSRNRLAGERVDLRIAATDAGDNTGFSPSIEFTLPERVFLNPLARAVAEQRREVMSAGTDYAPLPARPALTADQIPAGPVFTGDEPDRRIERAPQRLQRVARSLDAITDAPVAFFEDPIVYLGLRRELRSIQRAHDGEELGPLDENLWAIALRAELGSLADAEAALRAAERALMEALARGADESELAPLFEAYQEAMENYLAALAREAAEEGNVAEGQGGQELDTAGLQEMLDALRDAAELGDTADARRALQALGEMLRNMEMQLSQGSGEGSSDDAISEAMREALEQLGDVIGEQRELQDQTFDMAQGGPEGQGESQGMPGSPEEGSPGSGSPGQAPEGAGGAQGSPSQALADAQGRLADQMAQMQQGFGDSAEDALGGAAQAMRDAQDALNAGDAQGALDAQAEALDSLRDGAEQIARNMLDRMEEQQSGQGQGERDPLGRPTEGGGFSDGAGVDVPDEIDRQRAREILEELRRRSSEQGRPQDEIEYIERLLERFGS
tara:strand:- start:1887 stop:4427 length:2541 start_codon:yes stop_codon:yes gene_type:complete